MLGDKKTVSLHSRQKGGIQHIPGCIKYIGAMTQILSKRKHRRQQYCGCILLMHMDRYYKS